MMNSVDPSCRSTDAASDWLLLRFGSAPAEKPRQMFADHGIGCKRQAEFLQSCSTCLLRQIVDRGLCEKSVENHLLKGRSIKCCRNGSGEQARAS